MLELAELKDIMKVAGKTSILSGLLLVALCVASSAHAQDVNPLAVIERFVQAIGGQQQIAGVRNIRAFADCTGPKGKYTTEIHSAGGSRLIFKQVRQGGATFTGQTSGNIFWTTDEASGDPVLADKSAAFAWRSHEFQWLALTLLERFGEPSFAGYEDFAGKNSLKLSVKDELGRPASVFFDKDSGLMLGFVILNPFSQQPELIRTVLNEWKKVGQVKLPSKITVTDKQGDFVLSFQDISLNRINENIFSVPAKVAAMKELLDLHHQGRVAHFKRDAKLLVSEFAGDFTSVSNGRITKPTKEESASRLQKYFDNSTFLEWDDITAPVIKVSDDATMGYVIVHKKVRLLAKTETGGSEEETEVFAWVAIYRKFNGEWKLTTVVSTRTPEEEASAAKPSSAQ